MNVAILGHGEVGRAIDKLVSSKHQVFIRELHLDQIGNSPIDILHVCIPFTPSFNKIVTALILEITPQLTIINSTVKPGTTQALHLSTKTNIVHAPIDGVHPHLFDYLFKFTKPIGAVNDTSYHLAKDHFEQLGVKTVRFASPLETELAKILSTTYYGWNIIFEKWVHRLCHQHGANYQDVYVRYNQFYNQNYAQEKPEVQRPILKHYSGTIGGHCVIPNAAILRDWLNDDFSQFLLDQNQKLAPDSASSIPTSDHT